YVRGSDMWKRSHCHSVVAFGRRIVQASEVALQEPCTGVPGASHDTAPGGMIAYSALFEPPSGIATTGARPPAVPTSAPVTCTVPKRGKQGGAETHAFECSDHATP